jgi:hypothetical protein
MGKCFQLAVVAVALMSGAACAQISNPDNLVAPLPRNPARPVAPVAAVDVQWLWHYAQPGEDELALLRDERFAALLRVSFQAPQSFWRDGAVPLAEAAREHFGVAQSGVVAEGNRYISVSGCVAHSCPDQGLLWVDTLPKHELLIFAATDWTTQGKGMADPDAEFNLWIFPSRRLDYGVLPEAFVRSALQWKHAEHIHAAVLVDPDGTPHTLNPSTLQ